MTAGYSGTALDKKLGLARGMRVWFHRMPDSVRDEIDPEALGLEEQQAATEGLQAAHVFATQRDKLAREIAALRQLLQPAGFIWVSWPKRASNVASDITEDVVREIALPLGLVDVKVCAVDEVWSGLKLMIRKEQR